MFRSGIRIFGLQPLFYKTENVTKEVFFFCVVVGRVEEGFDSFHLYFLFFFEKKKPDNVPLTALILFPIICFATNAAIFIDFC